MGILKPARRHEALREEEGEACLSFSTRFGVLHKGTFCPSPSFYFPATFTHEYRDRNSLRVGNDKTMVFEAMLHYYVRQVSRLRNVRRDKEKSVDEVEARFSGIAGFFLAQIRGDTSRWRCRPVFSFFSPASLVLTWADSLVSTITQVMREQALAEFLQSTS
jgi:hypothetical protein